LGKIIQIKEADRRRDFIKIYGREPTPEELRTFIKYIELVKSGR